MLSDRGSLDLRHYTRLTEAELDAYRNVEIEGVGPRELARRTDRSPGTVGNLLRRAREKLGEGSP